MRTGFQNSLELISVAISTQSKIKMTFGSSWTKNSLSISFLTKYMSIRTRKSQIQKCSRILAMRLYLKMQEVDFTSEVLEWFKRELKRKYAKDSRQSPGIELILKIVMIKIIILTKKKKILSNLREDLRKQRIMRSQNTLILGPNGKNSFTLD